MNDSRPQHELDLERQLLELYPDASMAYAMACLVALPHELNDTWPTARIWRDTVRHARDAGHLATLDAFVRMETLVDAVGMYLDDFEVARMVLETLVPRTKIPPLHRTRDLVAWMLATQGKDATLRAVRARYPSAPVMLETDLPRRVRLRADLEQRYPTFEEARRLAGAVVPVRTLPCTPSTIEVFWDAVIREAWKRGALDGLEALVTERGP